jgi:ribosomal protein S18 acetylase RimI-like enzyme
MNREHQFEVKVVRLEAPSEIDLEALSRLFASVGMRERVPSLMRAAIEASSDVYTAYAGNDLVGFGRLISDEVYYGSIWDVAVEPSLQNSGLGSRILDNLLMCCQNRGLVMVGLFTASHNKRFYERYGFEFHPDINAMTKLPKSDQLK